MPFPLSSLPRSGALMETTTLSLFSRSSSSLLLLRTRRPPQPLLHRGQPMRSVLAFQLGDTATRQYRPLPPIFDGSHASSSRPRRLLLGVATAALNPDRPPAAPLLPVPDRARAESPVVLSASPVLEGAALGSSGMIQKVELGVLFTLWYGFNIYFNIYNKQVLDAYPFPATIATLHFAIGTVLVLFMWTTNLYRRPKISSSQLVAILPLAIVHAMGNLFTNISLGNVSVSFTHTIKAMEPLFSVVLSCMFLKELPTLWVVSSLVPIVGGVALASLTEVSFNWLGFWSAMASNLTNQSRNVLSKKLMVNKEESLDNITLFSVITVMSFLLMAPITPFLEGIKFTPSHVQSLGLNLREIYVRSLVAGLCYHAYQQVAYMILAKVSPITHSVVNCVKRVVVIVASVLFFKTPVLPVNSLGTGVALAGVFLYSKANRVKRKQS